MGRRKLKKDRIEVKVIRGFTSPEVPKYDIKMPEIKRKNDQRPNQTKKPD